MKKIVIYICCMLIFSIIVIGCGSDTEDITKETESTKNTEFKDMQGARFIFGTIRPTEFFQDEGYSSWGDNMRKRYRDVAEKFNCAFDVITLTVDACAPLIMSAVAVMTDVPDFIDCNSDSGYILYKESALVAYDDMTTLKISDSRWGPASFRANGIYNGKSYGVFTYDWEFLPQIKGIMLINNPLIRKNGMTDPYEMQEKKAWNWENFKQELIKGTYDDGENKYIGMTCEELNKLALVSALSNGARLVSENEAGNKYFAFDTPEAIQGFEFAASLNSENLIKTFTGQMVDFTGGSLESDGLASYLFGSSWLGTVHASGHEYLPSFLMKEYGFINFPNGPLADENNVSSYIGNERLIWCIGPGENEPDDKGMIMNYVFSPVDGSEKEGWKALAKSQIFHHPQDFNNFLYMIANSSYNYDTQLGPDIATKLGIAYTKIINNQATPAAAMESVADAVNAQLAVEFSNAE